MEDSAFKLCPFCKQQIRREAIKCRFCGEWLESSEPNWARKLATDKPVVPPPTPPQKGNEPSSMKAVGRSLDETYLQQRPANPPIPDIQNKTTPKASAKTEARTKTRVIIAIVISAVVVLATGFAVMEITIAIGQRSSTNSGGNAVAFDPQHEAAAESYLQNLGMEKFTSNEFGFSSMMPKERSTSKMDRATAFIGEVNGHSVIITAEDLPPSDPLYNVGSVSALQNQVVMGLSKHNISNLESPRNIRDKNGHVGIELMYAMTSDALKSACKMHAFKVGNRVCVVLISAPEAQWDKQLADSVLTTFAMQ